MKIVINDHRKIFAIQEEFASMFPNLEIEFFAKPSKIGSTSSKKLVGPSKKLLACRASHQEGVIEILPSMTIYELKDNFRDVFELTVEIVRKLADSSRALPVREKFTLEEENKLGDVQLAIDI